jgi:hypothetical protein
VKLCCDALFLSFIPLFLIFCRYNATSTKELLILNVGKVPFNFKIGIGKLANAKIDVAPNGSLVPANDKVRLSVKFTPTSPDRTEEQFTIQVLPGSAAPSPLLLFPFSTPFHILLEKIKIDLDQTTKCGLRFTPTSPVI